MSLGIRSSSAGRRSGGVLSSCPGGVRDSPGRPLDTARRAGRAACVPRIAVDPAGWCAGLTVLMLKRSGIGFPLDALSWTRISLSEEQRPLKEHHQLQHERNPQETNPNERNIGCNTHDRSCRNVAPDRHCRQQARSRTEPCQHHTHVQQVAVG
jgi:hypothetical protein